MPAKPVVQLEDVSVSLDGHSIMRDLSLEVSRTDRLCIVGPPGSGKSLLLELMAGRHMPHQGHLSYPAWAAEFPDAALGFAPRFAVQLVSTSEQQRVASQYATFHQARWHTSFTEPTTVATFLGPRCTYGLREFEQCPAGLEFPDHEKHLGELLAALGLEYLLTRPVSALSNGELRRLLLARALLARPRLLLLDDPLGGLDPDARGRVVDVLNRFARQECVFPHLGTQRNDAAEKRGLMTMVYTTPRPEELASLATRVFTLKTPEAHVPRRHNHGPSMTPRNDGPSTIPRRHLTHEAAVVLAAEPAPAQAPTVILRLRDATVRAGATTLLDCVSLEVMRGQHWLVTGPNGAGKSTLLALLLGDHPQSYAVDLEVLGLRAGPGVPLRERQRRIGFMAPELAAHYPSLWSVREVVLSGINASIGQYETPSAVDEQSTDRWLDRLALHVKRNCPLASLSEVETRKVFLARALIRHPALLLLDEPTQGLAPLQSTEMLDIVDSVVRQTGVTLLLVSHHALEQPRCITHHLALDRGRVVHNASRGGH